MKRNDSERELWVNNDEGLYNWFRCWKIVNRGGMRAFLRENRTEIDAAIDAVLNGSKPAHHLAYGPGALYRGNASH